MSVTRRLVLRPEWGFIVEATSTPQDVEAETQAAYFRQWQGDNALLNAHLAHWRRQRLEHDAWRAGITPYPRYTPSLLLYT